MLTREQYFPGHLPEEQVALFIRRHWMAFLPWILITPLILLVFAVLFVFLWRSAEPGELRELLVVLSGIFLLSVSFIILRAWMSYYLDVTIVTERRLIDIEQEGIFTRKMAELTLLRVQDVSPQQTGFLQHLMNYGTLLIETAGEQSNFKLLNIPRPNDVAKTILNLCDHIIRQGGQEVSLAAAEGEIVPETTPFNPEEAPKPRPPIRHPLEELRPYFPEPGLKENHHEASAQLKPKKEVRPAADEGELKEGNMVKLEKHRS